MQKLLMERHGLSVPDHTCTKALRLLRSWVDGKHEELYARLPEYIEEIKERNLGTRASCIAQWLEDTPLFKRLFISFLAMKIGFMQGCRSLIRIDGFLLKESYKGVLLIAMVVDANIEKFPVPYGVVETKNRDHWAYLFRALKLSLQGAVF